MAAVDLLRHRWRIFLAGGVGVATGVGAHLAGLLPGASSLLGWNAAAIAYLLPTGRILLFDPEAGLHDRAKREDENRAVIMGIVLGCVAFSFGAIVVALREAKTADPHGGHGWLVALSLSTIVLSWLVVQAMFAFHYAHAYFGDRDADGEINGGVQFQGDPPRTYRDFIYVAVCVGCCFQVSDFALTDRPFRNLVTVHALLGFAFNTLVLALGVNIVGNLMGS